MRSTFLVEREALIQANEDYSGLWELAGAVNVFCPGKEPQEKLRLAREAMRALLEKGYVRIYSTFDDEKSALPTPEAIVLLDAHEAWLPPSEGPGYWFFATKTGEAAYHESDEMDLTFDEAVELIEQCEAGDLAAYGVSVHRRRNGRREKPEVGGRFFREREGEKWADLRERCNTEALDFVRTFRGRDDLAFYVSVTSRTGPDLIWKAQSSR